MCHRSNAPGGDVARSCVVARSFVLRRLHERLAIVEREVFGPEPSSPGGVTLSGDSLARDLGYRAGHNAARDHEATFLRQLIGELEVARTIDGLRELRDAVLFEGEHVPGEYEGEGG